jgi:hypothetical protein
VRRLILLALGLSLLLGTAIARTVSGPPDIFTIAGTASCLSSPSPTPGDADQQWHPAQRTSATVNESSWKTMPAQALPAGTRLGHAFDRERTSCFAAPVSGSTLHYLRHTPLLI